MKSVNSIPRDDLEPVITHLGLFSGILEENRTSSDLLELNTDWFQEPFTGDNPQRMPSLLALLDILLGGVTEAELGKPIRDDNRLWFPLQIPTAVQQAAAQSNTSPSSTQPATGPTALETAGQVAESIGLFLVATPVNEEETESGSITHDTVFGIGLQPKIPVLRGIKTVPYAYLPIFQIAKGEGAAPEVILGQDGYSVEVGVSVTGEDQPLFSLGEEASLGGISLDLLFNFGADVPVEVQANLLNLVVPEQEPVTINLLDPNLLEQIPIRSLLALVISLVGDQIESSLPADLNVQVPPEARQIPQRIMRLLGLSGNVPSYNWEALIQAIVAPEADTPNPGELFVRELQTWLYRVFATPAGLQTWLSQWLLLLDPLADEATAMTGTGSRSDPFILPILDIKTGEDSASSAFTLALSVASEVDETTHAATITPGIRLATSPLNPFKTTVAPDSPVANIGAEFSLNAELLSLTLLSPDAGGGVPDQFAIADNLFPSISAQFNLRHLHEDGYLFKFVSVDADTQEENEFSLRRVVAGVKYNRELARQMDDPAVTDPPVTAVIPVLQLIELQAPLGYWPSLDLGQLALGGAEDGVVGFAQELIATAVEGFITPSGGDSLPPIQDSLAVLTGLKPPDGVTDWPAVVLQDRDNLLENPVAALRDYYRDCLTNEVWVDLMPSIAFLMTGDATVIGTGAPDDPWNIPIFTQANVPVSVGVAFSQAEPTADTLTVGIEATFLRDFAVGQQDIQLGINSQIHLLDLTLPEGEGISPDWMPGLGANLALSSGANSETLAVDAQIAVLESTGLNIAFSWERMGSISAMAEIGAIILSAENVELATIAALQFDLTNPDLADFQNTFGELALGFLRLGALQLIRFGHKPGILATAVLGLLPANILNTQPFTPLPDALRLPENWPLLTFSDADLSDPAALITTAVPRQLRSQMHAILAEHGDMLYQLLYWTLHDALPEAIAHGDDNDPWVIPIQIDPTADDAADPIYLFDALYWFDNEGAVPQLGLGVRRSLQTSAFQLLTDDANGPLQMETAVRLNLLALPLADNVAEMVLQPPACSIQAVLQREDTSQPLLWVPESLFSENAAPDAGREMKALTLGAEISTERVQPILSIVPMGDQPTISLGLSENGEVVADFGDLAATDALDLLENVLFSTINGLSPYFIAAAEDSQAAPLLPAATAVLELLGFLNVQITSEGNVTAYELSRDAWDQLLANPGGYFQARLDLILDNTALAADFYTAVKNLIGLPDFELPQILDGLPPLLTALGLLEARAGGYAILLPNWLRLFSEPGSYFDGQVRAFLADENRRSQLVEHLTAVVIQNLADNAQNLPLPPGLNPALLPEFRFNPEMQLAELSYKFIIAEQVALYASLQLDLQNLQINLNAGIGVAAIQQALQFSFALAPEIAGDATSLSLTYQLALAQIPGSEEAHLDSLIILPPPQSDEEWAQFGIQLTLFGASTAGSALFNQFVLPRYPMLAVLTNGIGLGNPLSAGRLQNFLHDPAGWFFRSDVLGAGDGQISIAKVGGLLAELAQTQNLTLPAGITLIPAVHGDLADGLTAGFTPADLPFAVTVTLQAAANNRLGVALQIASQDDQFPLTFSGQAGVAFGFADITAVSFSTAVSCTFQIPEVGNLGVDVGYALDTGVTLGLLMPDEAGTRISIIPFGELTQAGQVLLDTITRETHERYLVWAETAPLALTTAVALTGSIAEFFGFVEFVEPPLSDPPADDTLPPVPAWPRIRLEIIEEIQAQGPASWLESTVADEDNAAELLADVWNQYETWPEKPVVITKIVAIATGLSQFVGLVSLDDALTNAEKAALFVGNIKAVIADIQNQQATWIISQFTDEANVQTKITFVNTMLQNTAVPGFSLEPSSDHPDLNRLRYTPPITLPLAGTFFVEIGYEEEALGLWSSLAFSQFVLLSLTPSLHLSFPNDQVRFAANVAAGVGVAIEQLNLSPQIIFGIGYDTSADDAPFQVTIFLDPAADPQLRLPLFDLPAAAREPIDILDWLQRFGLGFLLPLLANAGLQSRPVLRFLNTDLLPANNSPQHQPLTPGQLLAAYGLVVAGDTVEIPPPTPRPNTPSPAQPLQTITGTAYTLADLQPVFRLLLDEPDQIDPVEVVAKLASNTLDALVPEGQLERPLITIGEGGVFVTRSQQDDQTALFGLRVQLTDIILNQRRTPRTARTGRGGRNRPTPTPASRQPAANQPWPVIKLQLGDWPVSAQDNWLERVGAGAHQPGISLNLVTRSEGQGDDPATYELTPSVKFVSVGLDVDGTQLKPLITIGNFRLGGIRPRFYFSIDDAVNIDYAFAARINEIGIPIGGTLDQASGSNPVAQSLLASGSSRQSTGTGSQNRTPSPNQRRNTPTSQAVNPAFSITIAYHDLNIDLRIHTADNNTSDSDQLIWLPLQRAFGPLLCRRLGIGWDNDDKRLLIGFDGTVDLYALIIDLVNLKVGIQVTDPLNFDSYSFELEGLNVTGGQGPVLISGGFVETNVGGVISYDGMAILKAGSFSLAALGGYSSVNGEPSLFLYALLALPLGGPPFFFVTGVAAGFGYNRDLIVPPISGVANFPFVNVARMAARNQPVDPEPNSILRVLAGPPHLVPPRVGQYWITAGIAFNSFQLFDSFALLLVKFGRELEIVLMGLSTFRLPKPVPGSPPVDPYLYVELQFKVAVKPAAGLFSAEAQLTQNSYLIDANCRLTGGFAFYLWFGGPRKGDFVLTIGGYHPRFRVPAHYPQVPRLGISWRVNTNLFIKGEAYFALTPSSVMAGGALEIHFQTDVLIVDFIARANFLISWKPFFYDIDVYIYLHIHVDLWLFSISLTLSADIRLWGPEFAGRAHIKLSVISFTVSFGATGEPAHRLLGWAEFNKAFLPQPEVEGDSQPICQVSIGAGLVREIEVPNSEENEWVVLADSLQFSTETFIPATEIVVQVSAGEALMETAGREIGFRPMGNGPVRSTHHLAVYRINPNSNQATAVLDLVSDWQYAEDGRRQGVPFELWNTVNEEKPPKPSADVLPDRIVGVDGLRPLDKGPSDGESPIFDLITFLFDILDRVNLPLVQDVPESVGYCEPDKESSFYLSDDCADPDAEAFPLIRETAMADNVVQNRAAIFDIAREAGFPLEANGRLDMLVSSAETTFQAPPMLGILGSTGSPQRKYEAAEKIERPVTAAPLPETAVRLLALLFQYKYVSSDDVSDTAMGGSLILPEEGEDTSVIREETTPDEAPTHDLTTGQSLTWQLQPNDPEEALEPALVIQNSQGQRVRIISLDRYGRLLNDEIVSGAEEEIEHPLTSKAAHVLATGLPGTAQTRATVGWHGSSALIQMRPRVFVGDDVLVRAQASRSRRQLTESGVGLVRGGNIAEHNLIVDEEAQLTSGWIRTFIPADSEFQTLAVSVMRSELQATAQPDTTVAVIREDGELLQLQPVHLIRESEAEYVLLYILPAGLRVEQVSQTMAILTAASESWQINGVMGIRAAANRVRVRWTDYRLQPDVIATEAEPSESPASVRVVRSSTN